MSEHVKELIILSRHGMISEREVMISLMRIFPAYDADPLLALRRAGQIVAMGKRVNAEEKRVRALA